MIGSIDMVEDIQPPLPHATHVKIGDNSELKVLGRGKVVISHDTSIKSVLLVESLGYNLLSVYQLSKCGFATYFDDENVIITWKKSLKVAFVGYVENGMYVVDFSKEDLCAATCLMAKVDVGWLWHRRLAHTNMRTLHDLQCGNHILGLTNVKFSKDRVCSSCMLGKQHGEPHLIKTTITTKRILELIHLDLFGPLSYDSFGGKKYCLVIVDDYSRYSWVYFFKRKNGTQQRVIDFITLVERQHNEKIMAIRSDNGSEFKNYTVEGFLSDEGIAHQYSTSYTPQQNGVAKRKNRTLMDAARTMIAEFFSPYNFWAEAVSAACHATNRLYLRKLLNKTSYEILTGKKPDISYFKVFGCKCFILKKGNRLSKFETRSYEGIFVGYATNAHAYRVYNKSTGQVEEAIDVRFDEDTGSQGGRIDHDVVGDAIPPIAIRRMGIGEIINIEHLSLPKHKGFFDEALALCEEFGLIELMKLNFWYDEYLVTQFYSTVHF